MCGARSRPATPRHSCLIAAIEAGGPDINPFIDEHLVIASDSLFTTKPVRREQALAAGWDLLVVDEAHHLGWTPEAASPGYAIVEALGKATPGLLLLTATPEQLGMASHFARLRLLDPDRFHSLDTFLQESGAYREVARLAAIHGGEHTVGHRSQFLPPAAQLAFPAAAG